jgi:hypothetical protein
MRAFVVSALLLVAGPLVCHAQEPQAVVDRFYPQQLAPSQAADRHSCYMVLRLTSINEPDAIVAGYTDGAGAVLRLLTRVAPDTYVVTYETPDTSPLTGLTCNLTGPDVDGDGKPDVLLELRSATGTNRWPFKWTGDTLVAK